MDSQDEAEDTILKANCSHEVMEENLTDAERMSDIREENEEGNSDNLSPDTSQSTSNLPQFYERGQPTMAKNEQSDTNSDSDESSIDKGPDSEEVSIADSSTVGANSTQDSLLVTGYSIMSPSHSRQTSIADSETYLSSTPDSVRIRSIDSRFQTRLSSLSSPNSHGFKREQLRSISQVSATDNVIDPAVTKLEAIRWTKLRKLSSQVYSDSANVSYGQPTVVLPCSTIAIGTEKGVVLIFDYHQNLLHILGQKQRALEWGAVTALCISSDQMFIGVGYAYGHITTWDIRNPQSPYIHIRPLKSVQSTDNSVEQLQGHLQGVKILHLSFLGKRRTALISGDVNGMAFFHDSKRSFMARTTRSIRLLGRYPDGVAKRKPTTIFGCSPRPIGIESERIDELGLIAIMTPYMMAIISTNSQPRTHFKVTRDKSSMDTMGLSGCLAWFPSLKSQPTSISKPAIPSRLAYSWSNILKIVTVSQIPTQIDEIGLNFNNSKKFVCDEGIVAIQWINRQVSEQRLI